MQFLNGHLDYFPDNLGNVSECKESISPRHQNNGATLPEEQATHKRKSLIRRRKGKEV